MVLCSPAVVLVTMVLGIVAVVSRVEPVSVLPDANVVSSSSLVVLEMLCADVAGAVVAVVSDGSGEVAFGPTDFVVSVVTGSCEVAAVDGVVVVSLPAVEVVS